MSKIIDLLDQYLYPRFGAHWDDNIFRTQLERVIQNDSVCLDYGAGRGILPQMNFMNKAKFVAGVDVDEAIFENQYLSECKLINLSDPKIPYEDEKFDVVYSNNVLEHIERPITVFSEIFRVLKPCGVFLSKTPNWLHYVPLIASLTPVTFHKFYNKMRGRKEVDTFPTFYNCNSRNSITRYANQSGFSILSINFIEGRPEYLRLFFLSYLLGFIYEKIINSKDLYILFSLRDNI